MTETPPLRRVFHIGQATFRTLGTNDAQCRLTEAPRGIDKVHNPHQNTVEVLSHPLVRCDPKSPVSNFVFL